MDTTKNLEILAYEESPIGGICLRRRELVAEPGTVVTEIMLDHALLMSSCNSASEEALSRSALALHPGRELSVLVGGLGLGCTAQALLGSDRVAEVEVVELLPPVIDWLERELLPLAAGLRGDPRFAVRQGDVFTRLSQPPERRYDLVLVDVDHAPDETLGDGNDAFYTDAGLARAKRHLKDGGVFGVWSYAESAPFTEALRRSFQKVHVEEVDFFNRLTAEQETNWLFFGQD